jgi:hypothetical protein
MRPRAALAAAINRFLPKQQLSISRTDKMYRGLNPRRRKDNLTFVETKT